MKIRNTFIIFVFSGFSQKRLTILNYSSSSQKVYKIFTKPSTGTYPFCHNSSGALGFNAGDTCYLANLASSTKFPFKTTSPVSYVSPVTTWFRQVNVTTLQNLPNNTIWNLASSATQEFNYAKLLDGTNPFNDKVGGIYPNFVEYGVPGSGWRADYERVTYSPGNYEDFIIFTDL